MDYMTLGPVPLVPGAIEPELPLLPEGMVYTNYEETMARVYRLAVGYPFNTAVEILLRYMTGVFRYYHRKTHYDYVRENADPLLWEEIFISEEEANINVAGVA